LNYETKDANTYASWNVDYLKYDNCNSDGTIPEKRYPVMRDALNASGRPIFFSMCGRFIMVVQSGVLINRLFGQQVLEIVGEQQETFKITGNRCWLILIL
jgi:hypothetical protein